MSIESRLFNLDGSRRDYDRIEYVNGSGSDRSRFETDFLGFEPLKNGASKTYSNGLVVKTKGLIYGIQHSRVIESNNL